MERKFLVQIFSKFDIKSKYLTLSIENQITRKFGKGFWIISILYLFGFILDVIRIIFFASYNPRKYGGIGYYFAGERIWFIIDLCPVSYSILTLSVLYLYHQDDNEWLMNINEFYNEIRDRNLDTILIQSSNRFAKLSKKLKSILIICIQIGFIANFASKLNLVYEYPVSYILTFIYVSFSLVFGITVISRTVIICLFLSFKYIVLFAKLNKQFSELNIPEDSQLLSDLLIIHNKLSDSVLEMNKFLKPIYVIIMGLFSPIICYLIFLLLYSDLDHFVSFVFLFVIISVSTLILTLSSLIAFIDIECDRSLHLIHGFALKIKDRQQIFQVLINLK